MKLKAIRGRIAMAAPFTTLTTEQALYLVAVAEAAQGFVDRGHEWIGGTKYCPDCMAEGWHYDGCKSGQEFWALRKALEDAVYGHKGV